MSAEDYEGFAALREHRMAVGIENRRTAAADFAATQRRAAALGLVLRRHSEAHYSLRHPLGWQLNIYPGNRRIWSDKRHLPRAPYVDVPADWTLDDVLDAVAKAMKGGQGS